MAKERRVKKVQARHILVGSKELAEELKVKIDEGEEFTKLAEEHSECPSKKRGGDLGWFGKGAMVRPFEVAAFTAQEGEVVGPINTELSSVVKFSPACQPTRIFCLPVVIALPASNPMATFSPLLPLRDLRAEYPTATFLSLPPAPLPPPSNALPPTATL